MAKRDDMERHAVAGVCFGSQTRLRRFTALAKLHGKTRSGLLRELVDAALRRAPGAEEQRSAAVER